MKILLIDVNCKYSSTGKIVYDLYRRLRADGHEASVAYGRGDVIDEPGIYKFGIDSETKKHALLARITGKNGCYSPKSTKNLINYIKEYKPDLIHIHELHAYFVNIAELLEFLKQEQIPVVWTFHCEYMYTGKCGFAYECEKYKNGCGQCPYLHEYISSFGIDKSAQLLAEKKQSMAGLNLKAIVTPSKWLADKTRETYLGDNSIQVIHNGIDTDGIFYPRDLASETGKISEQEGSTDNNLRQEYGIPADARLVLAVAPNIMDVRKGGQMVLDLAATMPDTQFVLVGADETKRHSENVQLIARTKNQDELARWYSEADLFIICSKAENFPTTCIEALCCGTPVVGLDACGTKETAPEPYGTFVPNDDHALASLRDAIATQLARNLTVEQVRNFAVENYDNSVMYAEYLKLYRM
ncbi:Glycosyltransferase involved in cell wall bisynthesis [Pseudobutyrivibrio sp. YE44]|uniref:glycosyltransferase n=1 Tax=Pseudobutyrivibrio sp. YE44 TaxID=1520802 RepID=UPI000888016E|nr:glycosyltransferase [Pseudobutyrivibrio sp. YE44]SDB38719.1 Glycosyltransferase involved in cell wall bisynthesis [Pseudobutyrivibrio sp. YE44]